MLYALYKPGEKSYLNAYKIEIILVDSHGQLVVDSFLGASL